MVCGANRDDYHLRYVTPGSDFEAEYFDLRTSAYTPGDLGTPLIAEDGTVLGGVQSKTAAFRVLNASGVEVEPLEAFAEIILAAVLVNVAEAYRDASGLVMPPAIAPFSVVITPVNVKDEAQRTAAERIYEQALAAGCDALLDDRDERPGVKFKDAELIGIPWRITVGKKLAEGKVEILERRGMLQLEAPVENAVAFVRERWDAY
jgi:prolyl-tRNA synthetase